jgi:type VI secretion system protein
VSARPAPATRRLAAAALACLVLAAPGCAAKVKTRAYAVQVAPEANQDSPVPLELVVVYHRDLLAQLQKLSAREWFQRREQFARDFPRGFRSLRWELVPGQSVELRRLPISRRGARAAFVFADYLTGGDHRLRLDPFKLALIELRGDDVAVRSAR